jgi:Leucine-rich repeat (LRR) protein
MSEEIFAYQEALRRIRDNFRTKATKLDLSDLDNLTDIPLEIGKLNHLTELLIGKTHPVDNEMLYLPDEVYNLNLIRDLNQFQDFAGKTI